MVDIESLLKQLNEEQIKPVLDTDGAVLVIAGAGSGKTRVLTTRIAYLVQEKHIMPAEIMAITFTNKAAGEMKERLSGYIGDIGGMWISTIHSMCVRILRYDADKIGYDKNFTIYDETDKEKVLKRVCATLGYDDSKFIKQAKNAISSAKNDCIDPEEFKSINKNMSFIKQLYSIYREYNNELIKSNAMDFDDLLYNTYKLFTQRRDVADYYAEKFKYIHIDEFQDTNKVQFALARMLASHYGNIFVVGDDDQSIYGWRGAKIENILSFDTLYPNAKVYKLEQNYRSTKKILKLANCIIAHNTERRSKELWTENDDGERIETFVGVDENNEATYTALQIKNLLATNPTLSYKDFAVFMRLNALSRAYEQEFTKYGIPYKIFGGYRFFERKEIKDILAYLKIINNPLDDESFLRSIAIPKRGIGSKTLQELKDFAVINGISLYKAVEKIDYTTINQASKIKLFNFKILLDSFKSYSLNHSVNETLCYILETTGFEEQFAEKTEENISRLYNISELKNSIEQFKKDNPQANLSDYLNSVTLSSDTDDINQDDAVTVATIHSVKGLEYKCVFVAGLDEGILPISRMETDLEEERRLMYVAVTRARERLYLTRASSRYMYGKREEMQSSQFLKTALPALKGYDSNLINEKKSYDNGYNKKRDYYYDDNVYDDDDLEDYEELDRRNDGYKKNNLPKYDGYGQVRENEGRYIGNNNSMGYSPSYAKNLLKDNRPKIVSTPANMYKCGMKVHHAKFGDGVIVAVKGDSENVIIDVAFKGVGIKQLSAKYAPLTVI